MSQTANISLGECMCGTDATWYRTSPPPAAKDHKRTSVGSIGLDDIEENLCDGCYKGFTGSLDTEVTGWKRVDSLVRQGRAGEDDQDIAYTHACIRAHSEAVPAQLVVPVMQDSRAPWDLVCANAYDTDGVGGDQSGADDW